MLSWGNKAWSVRELVAQTAQRAEKPDLFLALAEIALGLPVLRFAPFRSFALAVLAVESVVGRFACDAKLCPSVSGAAPMAPPAKEGKRTASRYAVVDRRVRVVTGAGIGSPPVVLDRARSAGAVLALRVVRAVRPVGRDTRALLSRSPRRRRTASPRLECILVVRLRSRCGQRRVGVAVARRRRSRVAGQLGARSVGESGATSADKAAEGDGRDVGEMVCGLGVILQEARQAGKVCIWRERSQRISLMMRKQGGGASGRGMGGRD